MMLALRAQSLRDLYLHNRCKAAWCKDLSTQLGQDGVYITKHYVNSGRASAYTDIVPATETARGGGPLLLPLAWPGATAGLVWGGFAALAVAACGRVGVRPGSFGPGLDPRPPEAVPAGRLRPAFGGPFALARLGPAPVRPQRGLPWRHAWSPGPVLYPIEALFSWCRVSQWGTMSVC